MIKVFIDGVALFNDLFREIENAKKYILIESFILRDDSLGTMLKNLLIKKSHQNVKILIVYDQIGCLFTSSRFFSELQENGIYLTHFFKSFLSFPIEHINNRNHQKIWCIDGEISYIGGFNIGSEYLGTSSKFGYWRDTHVKLKGPFSKCLCNIILKDVHNLANQVPSWLNSIYTTNDSINIDYPMEFIKNDPIANNPYIYDRFIQLIKSATKSIFIQTPYFIPDKKLLHALKLASSRGVDIRLMIPSIPDHPIVYWGTYYFSGILLSYGIKCFTYENGFLHAKTMVIDNSISCIGSSNLDMRSFFLNYETNAFIYASSTASTLSNIFIHDLNFCSELTLDIYKQRSLLIKINEYIARLLAPLL